MADLSEKKEYDSSYLNQKKCQNKIKKLISKDDDFHKYLKSIGLEICINYVCQIVLKKIRIIIDINRKINIGIFYLEYIV